MEKISLSKSNYNTFVITSLTSIVILLSGFLNPSNGQDAGKSDDEIFTKVDIQPTYPGGYDSLMNFIRTHLHYPKVAVENKMEGTVYVSFIIEKNGEISNGKIVKGIGYPCDEEAVRVIMLQPAWIPGKEKGKTVRVRMVMPIKFNL
jgi:protein TonB